MGQVCGCFKGIGHTRPSAAAIMNKELTVELTNGTEHEAPQASSLAPAVPPTPTGPPPSAPPALEGLQNASEPPPPPSTEAPGAEAAISSTVGPGGDKPAPIGVLATTPPGNAAATAGTAPTPIKLELSTATSGGAVASTLMSSPGHAPWAAATASAAPPPPPPPPYGWPGTLPGLPPPASAAAGYPHQPYEQPQDGFGHPRHAYLGQLGYYAPMHMPYAPTQDPSLLPYSLPGVAAVPPAWHPALTAAAAPPYPGMGYAPYAGYAPAQRPDYQERENARQVLLALVGAKGAVAGIRETPAPALDAHGNTNAPPSDPAPDKALEKAGVFSKRQLLAFRQVTQSRKPPRPLRTLRVKHIGQLH